MIAICLVCLVYLVDVCHREDRNVDPTKSKNISLLLAKHTNVRIIHFSQVKIKYVVICTMHCNTGNNRCAAIINRVTMIATVRRPVVVNNVKISRIFSKVEAIYIYGSCNLDINATIEGKQFFF